MESHGVPGAIQISAATLSALGEGFVAEPRGQIQIRGKGPMETWLIHPAWRGRRHRAHDRMMRIRSYQRTWS